MTKKQMSKNCKMKCEFGSFCDNINSDLVERQGRPVQACMVILIDTFELLCGIRILELAKRVSFFCNYKYKWSELAMENSHLLNIKYIK